MSKSVTTFTSTISRPVSAIQARYDRLIFDAIDSSGYDDVQRCELSRVNWLAETFHSEYGFNLARVQMLEKVCTDYLQGLPSACTIPFENYEILQWLTAGTGAVISDDQEHEAIDAYWQAAGHTLARYVRAGRGDAVALSFLTTITKVYE